MSKINHVQILNIADIIELQKYALNKQRTNTIKQYVEEQQANEQRAKKVVELLVLYREKCQLLLDDVYVARPYIEIDNRIIKLEKELEEMKL